ncbi:sulfatase [Clostridium carnis]
MRILMLDLDTLRADHLGCYGYNRNTTPNIDNIAKDSVVFNNYYCSDAPCLPSRAALISGRFGIHTGVVNHGGIAADFRLVGEKRGFKDCLAGNSLPAFLRQQGIHTATISPFAERHSAWWFNAGFNEVFNTGKSGHESAEEVTPVVLKWLEDNCDSDNWFLHVNYWDPHTPYRTPEEFGNPFNDINMPSWLTKEVFQDHRKNKVGPHGAREINMFTNETTNHPRYKTELVTYEDVKDCFDGYDCGIRYMDDYIGSIIKILKEKGIYDDMAIIVTSDHGEAMGEFGIYGEHGTADYTTTRIPMIVKWPGGKRNYYDDGLHYNLDLAPSLAELFNKDKKEYWDGRSYAKTILNGDDTGRDSLVLGQCAHVCQRSVRFDDYIYIRTYHDGFHLFPKEMLFNIKEDPHEQYNLAEKNRNLCIRAAYILQNWTDDMMMSSEYDVDPLWSVMREGGPLHAKGYLKDYCKRLEQTGRGWAVEKLKEKHPREFSDKSIQILD